MVIRKFIILLSIFSFVVSSNLNLSANTTEDAETRDAYIGFLKSIDDAVIYLNYSYHMQQEAMTFTGEGSLTSYSESFKLVTDDFQIYCDGKTKWTIDIAAEELYIENVADSQNSVLDNPALILKDLSKNFEIHHIHPKETLRINGLKALTLTPTVDLGNITGLVLSFKSDNSLNSLGFIIDKETLFDLTVIDMSIKKGEEIVSLPTFGLDEKTLSPNYIVTDLR